MCVCVCVSIFEREIEAHGPYRYTSNPLLVDKADIMQRREERTEAAYTHSWHGPIYFHETDISIGT